MTSPIFVDLAKITQVSTCVLVPIRVPELGTRLTTGYKLLDCSAVTMVKSLYPQN